SSVAGSLFGGGTWRHHLQLLGSSNAVGPLREGRQRPPAVADAALLLERSLREALTELRAEEDGVVTEPRSAARSVEDQPLALAAERVHCPARRCHHDHGHEARG